MSTDPRVLGRLYAVERTDANGRTVMLPPDSVNTQTTPTPSRGEPMPDTTTEMSSKELADSVVSDYADALDDQLGKSVLLRTNLQSRIEDALDAHTDAYKQENERLKERVKKFEDGIRGYMDELQESLEDAKRGSGPDAIADAHVHNEFFHYRFDPLLTPKGEN